jgi:uncharacterized protein YggE
MQNFFDKYFKQVVIISLWVFIFFLLTQSFVAISEANLKKQNSLSSNLITFNGNAEIAAAPDVVAFSITIREESKNVAEAQQKMTDKANKALQFLQEKMVEKKYIQTTNYSTAPKYIYQNGVCQNSVCQPSKQILDGYEATQTISVKVHDLSKIGEILTGISQLSISEVRGPNFEIADIEKLKNQAQELAIAKAKMEAKVTAKNLGIKLGKIVRFEEPNFGLQMRPMMMARMAVSDSAVAPQIEAGEQKISSIVAITYEIIQ